MASIICQSVMDRQRSNRVRRRSRSQKEKRKKASESERQKGDAQVSEELQKSAHENSTTSASSAGAHPSPLLSSHEIVSSRSEAHPNAAKNIINKPTLPSAKLRTINYDLDRDDANRFHLPQRSASYREFPRLKNSNFLDD